MRDRVFDLVAAVRRRLPREGRATRIFEPLVATLIVERGTGRATRTYVRRHGLTVGAGPFRGVRYPRASAIHVPGLAGRLAGVYESELHPAVERLIAGAPELIVNIGAGDGLYAVGLARRCPQATVIAYEQDPYPARVCARLAKENRVESRFELRAACTTEELCRVQPPARIAVVCDCEGAERALIDPDRVGWLRDAAMLIELHHSLEEGIAPLLQRRLAPTHQLESIEPARRFLGDYPMLWQLPGVSPVQVESLMAEVRPIRTSWLLALPRLD
jgi:hypothetical protein